MKGDQDRVMTCTTAQFDGVIAMINPDESWVVRRRLSLSLALSRPVPPYEYHCPELTLRTSLLSRARRQSGSATVRLPFPHLAPSTRASATRCEPQD